ncbi:ABC transporter ATP-binding protein [Roseomonas sp. GC11]|uniref:ABC transporter ATP-binding protein n=1 Tax=Roseomonas sp. GC11 TaxID=2950546 RepID=UPI00210A6301|nr:ABC transporter ATP-binding protein [Roseomonas sp. GC11]MCQ4162686.1 ABC transporter ATP-binding protein [Roseomonas sp. GC11]
MAHLELDRLTKSYGGAAPAVEDVSLRVEKGECIALLGPSGCGKTTTLRMVAGFIRPDAGHIRLDGRAIERDPPHRRRIGMVFQSYALFPHMTVAGNVGFGLEMRGVAAAEQAQRVEAALALVGLADFAARYPAQLSGGQQQRVALARALVIEPDLLLLDEPLSNLDATLRGEMRAEIARLQKRLGITTLFVTHDQEEAFALADRIVVMAKGRIVEAAPPRRLSEAPMALFTAGFLGARSVLPGRRDGAVFRTEAGLTVTLCGEVPETPSHVVLRAARLRLNPFEAGGCGLPLEAPARIAEAAWLGDHIAYEVEAAGTRIRVLRPTTEAAFAPGTPVRLLAGPEAITWIAQPETGQPLVAAGEHR